MAFVDAADATYPEWAEFTKLLQSAREDAVAAIRQRLSPISTISGDDGSDLLLHLSGAAFIKLKLSPSIPYAQTQRYLAWHELAGSSTDHSFSPKLDFPGEYSVMNFYRGIIGWDKPVVSFIEAAIAASPNWFAIRPRPTLHMPPEPGVR